MRGQPAAIVHLGTREGAVGGDGGGGVKVPRGAGPGWARSALCGHAKTGGLAARPEGPTRPFLQGLRAGNVETSRPQTGHGKSMERPAAGHGPARHAVRKSGRECGVPRAVAGIATNLRTGCARLCMGRAAMTRWRFGRDVPGLPGGAPAPRERRPHAPAGHARATAPQTRRRLRQTRRPATQQTHSQSNIERAAQQKQNAPQAPQKARGTITLIRQYRIYLQRGKTWADGLGTLRAAADSACEHDRWKDEAPAVVATH